MSLRRVCWRGVTRCRTRRVSIFKVAVRQPVIRRIIPRMESFIHWSGLDVLFNSLFKKRSRDTYLWRPLNLGSILIHERLSVINRASFRFIFSRCIVHFFPTVQLYLRSKEDLSVITKERGWVKRKPGPAKPGIKMEFIETRRRITY